MEKQLIYLNAAHAVGSGWRREGTSEGGWGELFGVRCAEGQRLSDAVSLSLGYRC